MANCKCIDQEIELNALLDDVHRIDGLILVEMTRPNMEPSLEAELNLRKMETLGRLEIVSRMLGACQCQSE